MWPAIAIAALVGSTALKAYSSYEQGKATQELSVQNAQVAEMDAVATEQSAIRSSEQQMLYIRRLLGTQKSLYSKAGVDPTFGSARYVQEESLKEGGKDAMAILAEGASKARRLRATGRGYIYQGEQAEKAGKLGAVGNILTGASNIAGGM
jgi:hypothetical protein